MPLDILPARLGGGLNLVDAPEVIEEGGARVLTNWEITGAGRLTPRKAMTSLGSLQGEIIGVFPYTHAANVSGAILTWDSVNQNIRLYTVNGDGLNATYVNTLPGWTSVTTKPRVTAATLYRVLFITDEDKNYGLTYYDPNDVLGSGVTVFRPTFNFRTGDSNTPAAAPLKCRGVVEYNNALLVWGYGDEADGDRPEYLRWSFLGFENDGTGAGDAGYQDDNSTVTSTGSQVLFDREDGAMVGERHTPIVAIAAGNGRGVVATTRKAFALYGSDRDTYQLDEIDNQRGCVATRAMCEANGSVYWMSPLGPCRYTGGGSVEDLARPVLPRLADMNLDSVFALAVPDLHQVRFYYTLQSDGSLAPDRYLAFDYYADAWTEGRLGQRVYCGGLIRPSGAEGPTAAPSSLTHDQITGTTARSNWVNGDTSPGVQTKVYRAGVLVATLGSGVSSYTHTGLAFDTPYAVAVEHTRNGATTSQATGNFTTLAQGTVAPPTGFAAADSPTTIASVLTSWTNGQSGVTTEIERKTGAGGSYALVQTAPVGDTSWRDNSVVADTTYFYRARHKDVDSTASVYTSEVSATPTDPNTGIPTPGAPTLAAASGYVVNVTISSSAYWSRIRLFNAADDAEIDVSWLSPGETADSFSLGDVWSGFTVYATVTNAESQGGDEGSPSAQSNQVTVIA